MLKPGGEYRWRCGGACSFDGNQAVAISIHAVDLLFAASGGKPIFLDNPKQRMFRDIHAMRAPAMNNSERSRACSGASISIRTRESRNLVRPLPERIGRVHAHLVKESLCESPGASVVRYQITQITCVVALLCTRLWGSSGRSPVHRNGTQRPIPLAKAC
jgi:Acyl-CoA dehydrogenase, C-terminal domain